MDEPVAPTVAPAKRAESQRRIGKKPTARSAVTNGRDLHVKNPTPGKWARRFSDLVTEFAGGEFAALAEHDRQLVRRAATIAISCEALESSASRGEAIDLALYTNATGQLNRCLDRMAERRAERAPKPPSPTIDPDTGLELTPAQALLRKLTRPQLDHLRMLRCAHPDRGLTEAEVAELIAVGERPEPVERRAAPQDPEPETPVRRYTRQMIERSLAVRDLTDEQVAALPPIDVPDEARGSGLRSAG